MVEVVRSQLPAPESGVGTVARVADPLIVSLLLDPLSQERFDRERRQHFPPGRTVIGAHVTLFHALPGAQLDSVLADLRDVAGRRSAFDVAVTEVMSLGRGAAYRLAASELAAVHAELAARWREWLTPQDRQPFRPHVTVQNKADPQTAAATLAGLRVGFHPFAVRALGLSLWRYVGGPWTALETVPFADGAAEDDPRTVGRGG